jgi:hypothetical protein
MRQVHGTGYKYRMPHKIHGTLESYMILDRIEDRLPATGYRIQYIFALVQCKGCMSRIQDTRSILQEYESGLYKGYRISDKRRIDTM